MLTACGTRAYSATAEEHNVLFLSHDVVLPCQEEDGWRQSASLRFQQHLATGRGRPESRTGLPAGHVARGLEHGVWNTESGTLVQGKDEEHI